MNPNDQNELGWLKLSMFYFQLYPYRGGKACVSH